MVIPEIRESLSWGSPKNYTPNFGKPPSNFYRRPFEGFYPKICSAHPNSRHLGSWCHRPSGSAMRRRKRARSSGRRRQGILPNSLDLKESMHKIKHLLLSRVQRCLKVQQTLGLSPSFVTAGNEFEKAAGDFKRSS